MDINGGWSWPFTNRMILQLDGKPCRRLFVDRLEHLQRMRFQCCNHLGVSVFWIFRVWKIELLVESKNHTIHGTGIFGCFQKIVGFPPQSSILRGLSITNHPFWGISPYCWKHPFIPMPTFGAPIVGGNPWPRSDWQLEIQHLVSYTLPVAQELSHEKHPKKNEETEARNWWVYKKLYGKIVCVFFPISMASDSMASSLPCCFWILGTQWVS